MTAPSLIVLDELDREGRLVEIGDNPRNPKWLHTVHGVGYRFEDPTKSGK